MLAKVNHVEDIGRVGINIVNLNPGFLKECLRAENFDPTAFMEGQTFRTQIECPFCEAGALIFIKGVPILDPDQVIRRIQYVLECTARVCRWQFIGELPVSFY